MIRPLRALPPLAASLSALAACHGSDEVVVVVPTEPVYAEWEPNDDAFTADDFGSLSPGDHVCIAGSVRDDPYDPQDGFAFHAAGPVVVDFTLSPGCACADLDVWVFDPLLGDFVAVFDSGSSPERGSVTVYSQSFHLVVVSAGGDTDYRLDVRASAWDGATAAQDGGSAAVGIPAAGVAREPTAALQRYPEPRRATGPARVVEVFAIDPRAGVVGRAFVPAGS